MEDQSKDCTKEMALNLIQCCSKGSEEGNEHWAGSTKLVGLDKVVSIGE